MIFLDLVHRLVHKCLQSKRWSQFFIWRFFIIKFYSHVYCSWKLTLHQKKIIYENHMFQLGKLTYKNGKNLETIKPCAYSQKNFFTSKSTKHSLICSNIFYRHQDWSYPWTRPMESCQCSRCGKIMHQTRLHVIEFDKHGEFKQNWQKNFNFNAQNKKQKKKINKKKG